MINKSLYKKFIILKLEILKRLYPQGSFVTIKEKRFQQLKWFFTKQTNNEYILGNYEDIIDVLDQNLKGGDTFIDLGAHWGYVSLFASLKVKENGQVYSFEPMPANFEILTKNIFANRIKNIDTVNKAVADRSMELKFTNIENSYGNSYISENESLQNYITISATSLDDFMVNNSVKSLNGIKIDVEGAEFDVLNGGINSFRKFRPFILLSTHEIHSKGVDKRCCSILNGELNYSMELFSSAYNGGIRDYICYPK